MRLNRSLIVAPITLMTVAACGGGDSDAGGSTDRSGSGDSVSISFANSYNTDHAHTRCGAQFVADKINEQDLGMQIDVFPNSQLGGDTDRVASVMSGDIGMDLQGSSALGSAFEPIGVMDAAYAFDNADHLFEFFDSEASSQLKSDFTEATGMRILDVWYFGDRQFTANQPITKPEDLDGLRMRFPDSPIYLENAKALGASATAVAFEEVFLALQQGIVDGQENPIPTIAANSFDEVQSDISLSSHQVGSQMVVISEDIWTTLSTEQQEALQTVVSETRAEDRQCIEDDEAEILDEWEQTGAMTVNEVDRPASQEKAQTYFEENLTGGQLELWTAIRESAS